MDEKISDYINNTRRNEKYLISGGQKQLTIQRFNIS
jgi:hypothetical protein